MTGIRFCEARASSESNAETLTLYGSTYLQDHEHCAKEGDEAFTFPDPKTPCNDNTLL